MTRRARMILVVAAGVFVPLLVFAADPIKFTPEIGIPRLFEGEMDVDGNFVGKYIRAMYTYFIWAVGGLATIMVTYGGIKWVAAAGNSGRIKDARDVIDNAVIGLIIALTSVVLLNTINPQFTNLSSLSPSGINSTYYDGAAVTRVCPWQTSSWEENNTVCGQIKKIGVMKDRNGKEVDEFCMGVWCPYGTGNRNGIKLYSDRRICNLQQNATTNFFRPGAGCISRVPIASTSAIMTDITPPTVTNIAFSLSFACGTISPVGPGSKEYRFGHNCPNDNGQPICYLLGGNGAIVQKHVLDQGKAQNAYCSSTQ